TFFQAQLVNRTLSSVLSGLNRMPGPPDPVANNDSKLADVQNKEFAHTMTR
ncbi:hypothetical protein L9F63_016305, partial [Diploptera punctata]